jgi:hypothetical protein
MLSYSYAQASLLKRRIRVDMEMDRTIIPGPDFPIFLYSL